jgi:hypothetical protein
VAAEGIADRRVRASSALPGLFPPVKLGADWLVDDRITRSRMAGDPPEVMVAPQLGHVRLLDFHRAEEAIDEGYACVRPLLGAVDAFRTYAIVPTGRGQGLFTEVAAWFDSSATDAFDFEGICQATGLDPDFIRKGLRSWYGTQPPRLRSKPWHEMPR